MLKEALQAPLENDQGLKQLAIGGGLLTISFGIVPLWVLLGYVERFVEETLDSDTRGAPPFDYWGLLMSRGVRAFGICLIYLIVPTVCMLAGGFLLAIAPVNNSVAATDARAPLTVAAVLYPIALYTLPAALLNHTVDERFRAGFAIRELHPLWFSGSYARGWLVAMAVVVVLHLCAVFSILTAIGIPLAPILIFYSYLVAAYVITTGVSEQLGAGLEDENGTEYSLDG